MSDAQHRTARGLTPDQLATFLAEPHLCRVSCLDAEGWPYVVPAWYQYVAGEGFYLVPRARSAWARYIQANPRVALAIDEEGGQHRRVVLQGEAAVIETPCVGGRWVAIGRLMAARYGAAAYLEATLERPRWLILVRPRTLSTWQGGDWHPRYLR
jgi:nitroimidazol reductase NimA-like FMN-containing flavoprotein (pyridoxamine 5'-phosphate oxidase superfamily)